MHYPSIKLNPFLHKRQTGVEFFNIPASQLTVFDSIHRS
jgi:hypothetical protein